MSGMWESLRMLTRFSLVEMPRKKTITVREIKTIKIISTDGMQNSLKWNEQKYDWIELVQMIYTMTLNGVDWNRLCRKI